MQFGDAGNRGDEILVSALLDQGPIVGRVPIGIPSPAASKWHGNSSSGQELKERKRNEYDARVEGSVCEREKTHVETRREHAILLIIPRTNCYYYSSSIMSKDDLSPLK